MYVQQRWRALFSQFQQIKEQSKHKKRVPFLKIVLIFCFYSTMFLLIFKPFFGLYISRELLITLLLSLICVKREQEQAFQKL